MTQLRDLATRNDQALRAERLQRLAEAMKDEGIDLLLVTPSADLQYLAQLGTHPSERPTMLAVQADGSTALVVPKFEAPLAGHLTDVRILTYEETQDPYAMLAGAVGGPAKNAQIAISDRTWSAFLLRLQSTFGSAQFRAASPLLGRLRMIKSEEELDLLARAGAMADAAFEQIAGTPFAGHTERHVASVLVEFLEENGLDTADWPPIVASGPNAASPHHLSGDREIVEGDAVVLDFGGSLQGYKADMTRTVHVGAPGDDFLRVYDVVRRAQEAGVRAGRPDETADAVDRAARGVIESAGYGPYFLHRTGHGIGLDIHEEPYMVSGNTLPLRPGMTFSVEPGVYLEGRFGVRIEDIVAVTDREARRLNNANHDLVVVT